MRSKGEGVANVLDQYQAGRFSTLQSLAALLCFALYFLSSILDLNLNKKIYVQDTYTH
jgi:hypothetical protein